MLSAQECCVVSLTSKSCLASDKRVVVGVILPSLALGELFCYHLMISVCPCRCIDGSKRALFQMRIGEKKKTYRHLLQIALLQNLLNGILCVLGAKLVLEHRLGRGRVDALAALLVGGEDLEDGNDLGQRSRLVAEPLVVVVLAVDEDEEVLFVAALVVDLELVGTAAHFEWIYGGSWFGMCLFLGFVGVVKS